MADTYSETEKKQIFQSVEYKIQKEDVDSLARSFNRYGARPLLELVADPDRSNSVCARKAHERNCSLLMALCMSDDIAPDKLEYIFRQIRFVNSTEDGYFKRQLAATSGRGNTPFLLLCLSTNHDELIQMFLDAIVEAGGDEFLKEQLLFQGKHGNCLTVCLEVNDEWDEPYWNEPHWSRHNLKDRYPIILICTALSRLGILNEQIKQLSSTDRQNLKKVFNIDLDWSPLNDTYTARKMFESVDYKIRNEDFESWDRSFERYGARALLELQGPWGGNENHHHSKHETKCTLLVVAVLCLRDGEDAIKVVRPKLEYIFNQIRKVNAGEKGYFRRQLTKTSANGDTAFVLLCANTCSLDLIQMFIDAIVEAGVCGDDDEKNDNNDNKNDDNEQFLREQLLHCSKSSQKTCLSVCIDAVKPNASDDRAASAPFIAVYEKVLFFCRLLHRLNILNEALMQLNDTHRSRLRTVHDIDLNWTPDDMDVSELKKSAARNDHEALKKLLFDLKDGDAKLMLERRPAQYEGRTLLMELCHSCLAATSLDTINLFLDECVRVGGDDFLRQQLSLKDNNNHTCVSLALQFSPTHEVIKNFIDKITVLSTTTVGGDFDDDESQQDKNSSINSNPTIFSLKQLLQNTLQTPQKSSIVLAAQNPKITLDTVVLLCKSLYGFDLFTQHYAAVVPSGTSNADSESLQKHFNVDFEWTPIRGDMTLLRRAMDNYYYKDVDRIFASQTSNDDTKQLLRTVDLLEHRSLLLYACRKLNNKIHSSQAVRIVKTVIDECVRVDEDDDEGYDSYLLLREQFMAQDDRGFTSFMYACFSATEDRAIEVLIDAMFEYTDRDFLRWQLEHKSNSGDQTVLKCMCWNNTTGLRQSRLHIVKLLSYFDLFKKQYATLDSNMKQNVVRDNPKLDFIDEMKIKIKKKADMRKREKLAGRSK